MSIKLQIYILCRDRLEYSITSIESVINSADSSTEVVISDNSIGDDIESMCLERFSKIRYVRRKPSLQSEEHFKTIIDEAVAEYLVLFHDDDVMYPQYVTTLLPYMEANPSIAAVACNAEIIDKYGAATGKFFMRNIKGLVNLSDCNDFIRPYLNTREMGNAPPFPSYLYRRIFINSDDFNRKHGGKHVDVTFLLKILRKKPMCWNSEILMQYRYHDSNDSNIDVIYDRLSLARFVTSHNGFHRRSPEMRVFKFGYWLNWWKNRPYSKNYFFIPVGWREKIIFRFLSYMTIRFALTDLGFWKARYLKLIKLFSN
jgi:hypothetical protein